MAEPEASVASVLAALPFQIGDEPCFVGAVRLEPGSSLAECALVPGCILTIGAPGRDSWSLLAELAGAVRVLEGPDAGQVIWLPAGRHEVSRDAAATVSLPDPQVSRRHAELSVTVDGRASVRDLGSNNGTAVEGVEIEQSTPLPPGAALTVGNSRLEWVPLPPPARPPRRSRDGRLDFDRAFARLPALTPARVRLPESPERAAGGNRLAAVLTALVTPMAMAAVSAYLIHNPAYLAMGLLGPAGVGMQQVLERRQRSARKRQTEQDRTQVAGSVAQTLRTQERLLRAGAPDMIDLTLVATGWRPGVWPRNARSGDGLVLRVGTGERRAEIEFDGPTWPGLPEPVLRGVPVTIDLRAAGVLGLVGPPKATTAMARSLLVQLASLRSPEDLRIVVVTAADDDELAWTAWLPHVDAGEAANVPCRVGNTAPTRRARITELRDLVIARTGADRGDAARGGARTPAGEEVVLFLDGALSLRHLPGMATVLRDGPPVGVYTVAVDQAGMNEASAECAVGETGEVLITRTRTEHPITARADQIGRAQAERMARALSPLRDRLTLGGAEAAVPYPVRFLNLLDLTVPTPADVLSRWAARPGPTTSVPLGADGSGTVSVDLAQQGPHTMLGGATGAGKSILLQTLVTSLLMANRPDELNLVLVDFKGGSAFLPFIGCPHVVGFIRSTGESAADVFDEAAAQRVLASVRAEVRRRESLLARYGGEIDELWRSANHPPATLPRLVMIFDEFARVLESSPGFLKELVNVAAKGRSLGMHLVLATQSLQGKLSPELKNNIDLRITLRQNEVADSVEVLGVPDAAAIPGRLRGRGMILCTKDEARTPTLFQSGYLGDPPPDGRAAAARVRTVDWAQTGSPRPQEQRTTDGRATDQEIAIAAVEQAAARLAVPSPFRPLLPPLPAVLNLTDLAAAATATIPATAVPYGLLDAPEAQRQPAAVLDLAGSDRLLVAGGPQSGRTTVATTLLTGLVTRFSAEQVHLYAIEREPGGLSAFASRPHCGGVFAPTEPDRIRRFIDWLEAEVDRRADQRFSLSTARVRPWIVVVIDGWEHFENRSDPTFIETSLVQSLRRVIATGPPLGVHVIPLGGQDLIAGKLSGMFAQRVVLAFPKEDTRRSYLPSGVTSPPSLPGRAVEAGTGLHLQVCWTGPDPAEAGADSPLPGRPGPGGPVRFRPMPARLGFADLPAADPAAPAAWIPLGVGGSSVDPVGVDLFEDDTNLMLVSGAPGSGRTTAAVAIIHRLRAAGIGVLAVAPPRSPLPTLLPEDAGVRIVNATTIKDADLREAAAGFGEGRFAVVLDDCDQITVEPTLGKFGAEEPTLLSQLAGPGARGRYALVLCGDILPILSRRRPSLSRIVAEIAASGWRLVLCPASRSLSREYGLELEPDQLFAGPPGRGYLIKGSRPTLVQLARSEPAVPKSANY